MTQSGSVVPSAFLGTLNFSARTPEDEAIRILAAAHHLGVGGINTADSDYSGRSELIVGRFLRAIPRASRPFLLVELSGQDMGVPLDPNLSPDYLRRACERSLARLGVDSVDRVVIPRPSNRIPLEETLDGVHRLIVEPGLAVSVGVSTFPAWMTCHGQHVCRAKKLPAIGSELAPYNILDRRAENEILPNTRYWGMDFFAWAPLAQGLLAGRYPLGEPAPRDSRAAVLGGIYAQRAGNPGRLAASRFVELCNLFGYDPASAALAWVLAQEGVTGFVAGPRTVHQVAPAAQALKFKLAPDFTQAVDRINPPGTAAVDFFNSAPWMMEQIR